MTKQFATPALAFNWLAQLADNDDADIIRIQQVHIDRGIRGSMNGCAAAQWAYENFGFDSRPRVSGRTIRVSNPAIGMRYRLYVDPNGRSPKQFDEGKMKPGNLIVSLVKVFPMELRNADQQLMRKRAAKARAWRAKTGYKPNKANARVWA